MFTAFLNQEIDDKNKVLLFKCILVGIIRVSEGQHSEVWRVHPFSKPSRCRDIKNPSLQAHYLDFYRKAASKCCVFTDYLV